MNISRHTADEYRRRISLAMNYISQHLETDLPLDVVAKAASFSPFHFHRIFKIVVGETVSEFTRRLRLELAANRLLSSDELTITQIALDCGFSSSQNFAKAFRAFYKMTPSVYRKSKIGNKHSKNEDAVVLSLRHIALGPSEGPTLFEKESRMKPEIKEVPAYHVAFIRKVGPYGKETCEKAFRELMQWAGPKGYLEKSPMLGVYWDNPEVTASDNCRTDACIVVPPGTRHEGAIGIQDISGGTYAVCTFEISENEFQQAWTETYTWVIKNGYECADSPCYELYLQSPDRHPQGKWKVNICIPLKNK